VIARASDVTTVSFEGIAITCGGTEGPYEAERGTWGGWRDRERRYSGLYVGLSQFPSTKQRLRWKNSLFIAWKRQTLTKKRWAHGVVIAITSEETTGTFEEIAIPHCRSVGPSRKVVKAHGVVISIPREEMAISGGETAMAFDEAAIPYRRNGGPSRRNCGAMG